MSPTSHRAGWWTALLIVMATCSCGVPDDSAVTAVADDAVPYHLLDPAAPSASATAGSPGGGREASVYWIIDERLVPATTDISCGTDPLDAAREVLARLAAGPSDEERASGRSTAIPPESTLTVEGVSDQVASVHLETATSVSPDRLPVAVGQVALSLASGPGVHAVVLVADGERVPVPLPGGALTPEPVGLDDYADLLPRPPQDGVAGCQG